MKPALLDVPVTRHAAASVQTTPTPAPAPAPAMASSGPLPFGPAAQAAERAATAELARRMSALWELEADLTFLNHGSYGACPRPVSQAQASLRARMEREPVRFFKSDLEVLLDEVRERVGVFVNAPGPDIAPIRNATLAIATVLANTPLAAGDEVLLTDHEYTSGINELERMTARTGAKVITAAIPFPPRGPEAVVDAIMAAVTPRTRLAIISHITSATSLVFPVAEVTRLLRERGIEVLVDGAHGPGQTPVDIRGLDPTYYIGSLHKWVCAPKGTGFLYVNPARQRGFRPVFLSSRAAKVRPDRELFLRDYDYMGTDDYSAILASPAALEFMGGLLPGGWPEVMRRNRDLLRRGRGIIWRALSAEFGDELPGPAPESMLGSMATLSLPEPPVELLNRPTKYDDALQDALLEKHRVATPIWRWGPQERRVIRLSAQLYNHDAQYERLAEALVAELKAERAVTGR
ncbi:MAG: aminotransferase class V-fold PLP-dependent enzyme [Phycisphaerales bacterium]|nr:aminotransferase class V-fold PLP-dependent enzyme [Phycisphaerales bacterium]